jgi:hypothetical protein
MSNLPTPAQAKEIQADIESVLRKLGVWYTVKHVRKPGLSQIIFEEISIKVGKNDAT